MYVTGKKELLDELDTDVTSEGLNNEPMLFQAGWMFACANGGEYTQHWLRRIKPHIDSHLKLNPHLSVMIDTRVHYLHPGHYPCIPGWHCDFFPRDKDSRLLPHRLDPAQVHLITHQSTKYEQGSATEMFPFEYEISMDGSTWADIHTVAEKYIRNTHDVDPDRIIPATTTRHSEVNALPSNNLHRCSPARTTEHRIFYRCSLVDRAVKDWDGYVREQTHTFILAQEDGRMAGW